MIHKIFTLRSCGQQSLGNIKPNDEYVCILQFATGAVCKEKNGMLEPGFFARSSFTVKDVQLWLKMKEGRTWVGVINRINL